MELIALVIGYAVLWQLFNYGRLHSWKPVDKRGGARSRGGRLNDEIAITGLYEYWNLVIMYANEGISLPRVHVPIDLKGIARIVCRVSPKSKPAKSG